MQLHHKRLLFGLCHGAPKPAGFLLRVSVHIVNAPNLCFAITGQVQDTKMRDVSSDAEVSCQEPI